MIELAGLCAWFGRMLLGRFLLGVTGLFLLGGCVGNLMGGGKPDALYRFGAAMPAVAGSVRAAPQTVMHVTITFAPEVDGDRLLAMHGQSALYIKGMRWVATAPVLFSEGLTRSFQARAPDLRLTHSLQGEVPNYALAVNVSRFEAQYGDDAMIAPPTIVIESDAILSVGTDRRATVLRHFAVHVMADKNSADAIAEAFDRASTLATSQITDWAHAYVLDNSR